jgi:glycosyltransferase involved in cell wall biosynthesis
VSYVHAPQVWEAARWGVARPGWGTWLERAGELPQLRDSDVVACVSDEVATELIRLGVRRERVLVSPMAVDAHRFTPAADGARVRASLGLGDAFVVGWVGSFRGFHGIDAVIDAFAVLHGKVPAARLLLGGGGARVDDARDRAWRLGISDSVVMPGGIPNTDMPAFLRAMDVAVVSARPAESFHYSPIKLREYLACGVASVAPRLGEIPRTVSDGEHALLYEPGDAAGLAAALVRLEGDPLLREQLGRRGRELAISTSTWDVRLADLLAFPAFRAASERRVPS